MMKQLEQPTMTYRSSSLARTVLLVKIGGSPAVRQNIWKTCSSSVVLQCQSHRSEVQTRTKHPVAITRAAHQA